MIGVPTSNWQAIQLYIAVVEKWQWLTQKNFSEGGDFRSWRAHLPYNKVHQSKFWASLHSFDFESQLGFFKLNIVFPWLVEVPNLKILQIGDLQVVSTNFIVSFYKLDPKLVHCLSWDQQNWAMGLTFVNWRNTTHSASKPLPLRAVRHANSDFLRPRIKTKITAKNTSGLLVIKAWCRNRRQTCELENVMGQPNIWFKSLKVFYVLGKSAKERNPWTADDSTHDQPLVYQWRAVGRAKQMHIWSIKRYTYPLVYFSGNFRICSHQFRNLYRTAFLCKIWICVPLNLVFKFL